MNERFAFDDICICLCGYFVSAYICIFCRIPICILSVSSSFLLLNPVIHESERKKSDHLEFIIMQLQSATEMNRKRAD